MEYIESNNIDEKKKFMDSFIELLLIFILLFVVLLLAFKAYSEVKSKWDAKEVFETEPILCQNYFENAKIISRKDGWIMNRNYLYRGEEFYKISSCKTLD